jgi:isoleucyl-tRNA synthetase
MAHDLKDTLQLPRTDFPMRAELPRREPARVAHWEKTGLYEAIQHRRGGAPAFVLHDGPPFTNGDLHLGHTLNRTLKEIVLRYKSMRGFRTPYVPGWDCHGLPIEQKVSRELQEAGQHVTVPELRARCDAFSELWIGRQRTQVQRLGVLADWKNEYKTKAPAYEADIVRTFAAFVEQGLVYRSKKPVYWSIPFETALAEAEIEYKEHSSIAIWVKFCLPQQEADRIGDLVTDKPVYIVIWTTTPWTLPANLAIAVNPDARYVVAELGSECIIVAEALLDSVVKAAKIESTPRILTTFDGGALVGRQARHPFIDRASPVVLAKYVTTDSGTGCVHTAPGHGAEDYQTGLEYELEIYCPVGDDGKYLDDGRVPADLVGLSTLESVEDLAAKRTSAANVGVLKKLAAANALFAKQKVTHSYPHCWRSKTPIIFRAVDQWFVSLDRSSGVSPRATALAEIGRVAWIPPWGEARIRGAIESRPDWCVSRQRTWGVPIPAFYGADKKAYLDAGVARGIADKFARHGTNHWYEATAAQLLDGVRLPAGWPAASELTPGRDTLDVWFDSGSTHAAVLKRGSGGTHWPADLYLEGSDQHRGWFQSSLWTGVIALGGAPFKSVLTHGFVLDEERKKLSKSSTYEKPPTSDAYVNESGADVIRLWIASQDFRGDIPISKEILSHVSETYRQVRNTFRYQLSVLHDFDPAHPAMPAAQLDTLDRWALHQTAVLIRDVTAAYEAYEFHRVYQLCNQFCAVTLSATYHDILKDRLYTLGTNSPLRRSSQTAIHHIFRALVRLLAPIIPFTTDEAWSYGTTGTEFAADSIHLQDWPAAPAEWTDEPLAGEVAALLKVRTQVNEAIEPLRAGGKLGKSLDAAVALSAPAGDATLGLLEKHRDFLPELFIVSHVTLTPASSPLAVTARPCSELGHHRCPRCWRSVPELTTSAHGEVCPRCAAALSGS